MKYLYVLIGVLIVSCHTDKQDGSVIVKDLNDLMNKNRYIDHNLKVAPFVGKDGIMPDPVEGKKVDTVFILKNKVIENMDFTKLNQGKVMVMDSLSLVDKVLEFDKPDNRFGRRVIFPGILRFVRNKNKLKIYMERWISLYPDGLDKKGIPIVLYRDLIYITRNKHCKKPKKNNIPQDKNVQNLTISSSNKLLDFKPKHVYDAGIDENTTIHGKPLNYYISKKTYHKVPFPKVDYRLGYVLNYFPTKRNDTVLLRRFLFKALNHNIEIRVLENFSQKYRPPIDIYFFVDDEQITSYSYYNATGMMIETRSSFCKPPLESFAKLYVSEDLHSIILENVNKVFYTDIILFFKCKTCFRDRNDFVQLLYRQPVEKQRRFKKQ